MLDFTRPVAVLLVTVLHYRADADNPQQIVATLREALAPGSYLVICHACRDAKPDVATAAETAYKSRVATSGRARTREEIARFFDGFTLIGPGLVWLPAWHPDRPEDVPEHPERFWNLVGVGRLSEP